MLRVEVRIRQLGSGSGLDLQLVRIHRIQYNQQLRCPQWRVLSLRSGIGVGAGVKNKGMDLRGSRPKVRLSMSV